MEEFFNALKTEWGVISDFCAELTDSDWETDTVCTNWTVKDNLSHLIGTELFLLGQAPPEIELKETSHIKNEIGKINESFIEERRGKSGAEVLAEFNDTTQERVEALSKLTPEEWEAECPSPVGVVPYSRFMRVRLLDCWMHEQDMREAVGKLRNEKLRNEDAKILGIVLDEIALALGFVVGKKAGAPDGCKVEFELTGTVTRTIGVEVLDGRGQNVDGLVNPDIKIEADSFVFSRLTGGRIKDADQVKALVRVETSSEHALTAKSIVENLDYMI